MTNIGLVGAGGWGRNHARVLHELGRLKVVCDLDPARRIDAETQYGVTTTARFEDVLSSGVDAVVLASPAAVHAEMALAAIDAGKHVLVEKPLALSQADARKVGEAAESAGLTLMVDHVLEYHPAVQRLHDLVHDGELGRIRYVSSHRLNFGRVRIEEDALWSFAPHDLSMMVNILGGMPQTVSCQGGAYLSQDVADVTLMNLEWAGGIRGYVFVSWLHPFKEHRFVVVGDRQMAVFDDTLPWGEKLQLFPHRVDWLDGRVPVAQKAEAVPVPLEQAEPLKEAHRHFLSCIENGTPPRTGAENGTAVVELLEAGRHSLVNDGAAVSIGDVPLRSESSVHPTATVDPGATIGPGTKIWHHSHVMPDATIGADCVIGQDGYVGSSAVLGDRVKVQNNVSVYDAVTLEDDVFVGPSAVFTNVVNPRSEVNRRSQYAPTRVRRGASLGANSTIVCPIDIGEYAFVGAGAVVTHDVPAHALVVGNPARAIGWMCACGERLPDDLRCNGCDRVFERSGDGLSEAT